MRVPGSWVYAAIVMWTRDRLRKGAGPLPLQLPPTAPWAGARSREWFGDVTITLEDDGETLLTCPVEDQAALHGLLRKIRDLGTPLISASRVKPPRRMTPTSNSKLREENEK